MNNIQSKVNYLHKSLIRRLCSIKEFPKDFLPHTVFVEEEDSGDAIYRRYKLTAIFENGDCTLINPITNEEREDSMMEEICIDWLVTLWTWYEELIHPKQPVFPPEKESCVFLYPQERFERNATDEEIVSDYDIDEGQEPCVEKYTLDEFAAMLNDGDFVNQNMYTRFIEN